MAVLNDIEMDIKAKCIITQTNQVQLSEAIGTTAQHINRIVERKEGLVNKTLVKMMDALGYDIELTYVKK